LKDDSTESFSNDLASLKVSLPATHLAEVGGIALCRTRALPQGHAVVVNDKTGAPKATSP
jgi:hypothetical protein